MLCGAGAGLETEGPRQNVGYVGDALYEEALTM